MSEERKEKLTATAKKLFHGDVTLKKMDLWLIGSVCLLAGIVYGIKKAPWTHGVMIGSNNGSHNQDNNNHNQGSLSTVESGEEQEDGQQKEK